MENQAANLNEVKIAIVVARSKNGVIGKDGDLPWHLPKDLKNFKAVTMGKPVLMGRKTFQSLPGILPNRPHFVISRDIDLKVSTAFLFSEINTAIMAAKAVALNNNQSEICIIGGGEIYRQCLEFADKIYLTIVDCEIEGDTYFPDLSDEWQEVSREYFTKDEKNNFDFTLKIFERPLK